MNKTITNLENPAVLLSAIVILVSAETQKLNDIKTNIKRISQIDSENNAY
jgi:hypothetical protein